MTRLSRYRSVWPLVLLLWLVAGCATSARRAAEPLPEAVRDRCATPSVSSGADTLVLGLADPVRAADAPVPANDAEQLVFSQVYSTLIRADCTGQLVPALASGWSRDAAGRWTFHIRPGRFSDSRPITAFAVIRSWADSGRVPLAALGLQQAEALDDSTLRITPVRLDSTPPRALAGYVLAVGGERIANEWPAASGQYQRSSDSTRLDPRLPLLPVLRLRTSPRGDARDLLDQGADLVVTRDPRALAYVTGQPQFHSVPLGWSRRYFLITRGTAMAAPPDSAALQVLADAAVRVEARPARAPDPVSCDGARRDVPLVGPELAVPVGDPTAALLGQRLIALANSSSPPAWLGPLAAINTRARMIVIPDDQLRQRAAAAVIVGVSANELCPGPELTDGHVVPLIETRARAILRQDRARIATDWYGGLTIIGPASEP